MRSPLAALLSLASIAWLPASAMVTRHDRDAQAFIELARRFPSVVAFHHAGSDFAFDGMGTLIDPRWVLTAGHIAAELAPGDLAEIGGANHEIAQIVQYPNWTGVNTWEDVKRDIALVRLKGAVADVEPARLYTRTDEAGLVLTLVGRGRYGTGLTGPVKDDDTMRAVTNRVHAVEGTQIVFRFDAPGERDATPLEGICGDGDSGGPAFLERGGVTYLVAVGSAQDSRPTGKKLGRYGVLELFPRVSSFASWIRATMEL